MADRGDHDGTFSSDPNQLGFDLGGLPRASGYEPNRDEVRAGLKQLLDEARAATREPPWDERTLRYNKIVFLQMSRWLPDDEAKQLCLAFDTEVTRLELLYAA